MSVALNERKEIHDRFEKFLDTTKDLPTLPPTKSLPKIQRQEPTIPPEVQKWCADGYRDFIYYTSSPAMKVVWWIRYHPIAITTTAVGVIASLGMLYNTYGR